MLSNNVGSAPMQTKGGTIEKCDVSKLTEGDIKKIQEIEQDSWGYFVGEYVSCNSCKNIDSKADIYKDKDSNYSNKSIAELEKIYGCDDIHCTSCGGETQFLRGEEGVKDIKSRLYDSKDGYVSVLKNKVGEIMGCAYGYVDTFEGAFEKDLSFSFSKEFLQKYDSLRNETVFMVSGICIEEKCKGIDDVYNLIRGFFSSVDNKYDNILGVYESIVGTLTYDLFIKIGGQRLLLPENGRHFYNKDLTRMNTITDVTFHKGLVQDYKKLIDVPFRDLIAKGR
ncbi:hypothetical protein A9Q91_01470 [Candidatus Gracilibacteria bacterium 28_42_T64]|nr:hypothetical protein A9Q91_01470 [Candidatus Gracilibacteria bacterium 28_42_T64]